MELLQQMIGVVVGGGLALAGSIWTTMWGTKAAAQARREERLQAAMDERRRFELATLTELDDALTEVGRRVTTIHLADERRARETGVYGGEPLPDELGGEDELLARQRLVRLANRVLTENIRSALTELWPLLRPSPGVSLADGQTRYQRSIQAIEKCQDLIAGDLRSIYTLVPRSTAGPKELSS